ncbi:hypothetical protein RRSWK_05234 [Rhodopirellula sp. SWK7]|nr:hypothetical protein RRSWK_05234 [Rhodopirellula sp. SWK7]
MGRGFFADILADLRQILRIKQPSGGKKVYQTVNRRFFASQNVA